MKRFIGALVLAGLWSGVAIAQKTVTAEGSVTTVSGTAIPAATVRVLNSNFGSIADSTGRFLIRSIPSGNYQLQVNAVNYGTRVYTVTIDGKQQLALQLLESSAVLDELIVTAQKRDELLQSAPYTISTLPASKVADYKLWNLKDIGAIIPNLNLANPGDNRNVASIRGIASSSYDPAIATYVDGVNQFNLDTYIPQLEDVERIEVLRGPQGTLYGRNAMGGVINVITRQPGNTTTGSFGLTFGNFDQQRYSLSLRTPVIRDRLFVGGSGVFTKQRGFFRNEFNDSDFDDQSSLMGNYFLRYLPTSKLSFTLNAKHVENRNSGAFPLAGSIADALSQPYTLNQNSVARLVDNVFNLSLSANYTGTKVNLTSQTAYQSNYRYYRQPLDADFSPIDGFSVVNNYGRKWNNVKVLTQELRFSSPANAGSTVKWVAGTYLFYQHSPVKQGTHIGNDAPLLGIPDGNFTSINTNVAKSYGMALFGETTVTLSEAVDLVLGARYDYEHKNLKVSGEFQPDGMEPMPSVADTARSAGFHALSPKLGLLYRAGANSRLYANYSRGFRAGGISQLSADVREALQTYKPEFGNNFEIGAKNTLAEGRLRLNAALFLATVNNAQVPTLILPDAITVTRNAGRLTSRGAEAELQLIPIPRLEAEYTIGYTHARYTRLDLASDGSQRRDDNRQVFTPDLTSNLALQYGTKPSGTLRLRMIVRGEWRYVGKQYFDLDNQLVQNGYHLLNSRIGVTTRRFDLFFWGANLAGKKYVDYAYSFGAAHLANPRIFGISLKTNF